MKLFFTLAIIQLLLAGCTLIYEGTARSSDPFTGPEPIEHVASWQRVILFSACAAISVLVALAFMKIKPLADYFPSFKIIVPIALIPFMLGIVFSHYFDRLGFCCDTPFTFFFGFPFSALTGMKDDPSIQAYAHYGLFDILFRSDLHLTWGIRFPVILNAIFWINISSILCGLGALIFNFLGKKPDQVSA